MSSHSIQHITNFDEYKKLIQDSTCVVKFTAHWCGPCKRIGPFYQTLAKDNGDKIKFLEVDIDAADEISNYENVKSIPYFIFYYSGKKAENLSITGGNQSGLSQAIKQLLDKINSEPKVVEQQIIEPQITFSTERMSNENNSTEKGLNEKTDDMSKLALDELVESDLEDNQQEQQHFNSDEIPEYENDDNLSHEFGQDIDEQTEIQTQTEVQAQTEVEEQSEIQQQISSE